MAKRDEYLANIRRKLSAFMVEVGMNNQVNRQNINISGEDVSCGLLNLIFDWELINTNGEDQNFPAVDLVDWEEVVAVQVTSDTTSTKIKKTLEKVRTHNLDGKLQKLIVLLLREKPDYTTEFSHDGFELEILDLYDISKLVERLPVKKLGQISAYLDEELGSLFDAVEKAAPTHRLPPVPAPAASFVEGSRDKELAELKDMLSPDAPVFLCGVGGIGKTELAIQLAKRFAPPEGAYFLHYYDTEEEALRETILRANFTDYTYNKPDNDHRDREYRERMDILGTEYSGAMLVIDNFDIPGRTIAQLMAEPAYRELTAMGIRLVFTTRSRVRGGYEIKPLDEAFLLKLMRENLDGVEVSDEELRRLIEAVEGHTLMTVLMARTLAESWGDVTPEIMLEALKNSDLNRAEFPEVVSDQNQSYEQRQIYAHMRTLFDLSRLKENEAESAVLRCATLLPEDGMEDRLFKSCIPQEQHQPLRNLVNRGLLRHEDGWLTIHPVIREVCRTELEPTDANCGKFLNRLWNRYSLSKEFYADKFTQIARSFSMASDKLEDKQGEFALRAGRFWSLLGQAQTALRYELRMVERREKDPATNPRDLATAYNNVGSTYGALGDHQKALEYKLKALAICEKVLPPEHPHLAAAYNNVGVTYDDLGDQPKALEYNLKALAICEKVLPAGHPDLAQSYNNVGYTYGTMGDHRQAMEYQLKSLAIREKVLPAGHPDLAQSYNNVGYTYGDLGDHRRALEYNQKALVIREKVLPPEHPDLALSYNNVGYTYGALGDHRQSLEYNQKALAIREKVLPAEHPDLALSYNNMGMTYGNLGDHRKALEYNLKALAIWEKVLPAEHPDLALSYNNVGYTYGRLGDDRKALELHSKALAIREKALPAGHPQIEQSKRNIAIVKKRLAEKETAAL